MPTPALMKRRWKRPIQAVAALTGKNDLNGYITTCTIVCPTCELCTTSALNPRPCRLATCVSGVFDEAVWDSVSLLP
jgi:hypothetical protein